MNSSTERAPEAGLIASSTTQALAIAQNTEITPKQPDNLKVGEAEMITSAAKNLVESFRSKPTDLSLAQVIGTIGTHSQFEATRKTALMQVKLKPLMEATSKGDGAIPKGLVEMRKEVEKIDPQRLMQQMQQGWVGLFVSKISSRMKDVLGNIAQSYDSAEEVINAIVEGLLKAKGGLNADNIELAGVASEVEECLSGVRKDAYQSELVFEGINALPAPDPGNMLAVRARGAILQRLVSRIMDLRTMETLLLQLETEMQSIFNDNNDLADAIDRSATITRVLLTVGLINAIALHKQKQTIGVVKGQRAYNTKLLQSLAAAAGLGAIEVAKLLEDPAVTFQGLETAHKSLVTSLDKAESIKNGRIQKAQTMLPKLSAMSAELTRRIEGLKAMGELSAPGTES